MYKLKKALLTTHVDDHAHKLSADDVRNDVTKVVLQNYKMTVPEFMTAVNSGSLEKDTYVKEVLAWLSTLPKTDPVYQSAKKKPCPA